VYRREIDAGRREVALKVLPLAARPGAGVGGRAPRAEAEEALGAERDQLLRRGGLHGARHLGDPTLDVVAAAGRRPLLAPRLVEQRKSEDGCVIGVRHASEGVHAAHDGGYVRAEGGAAAGVAEKQCVAHRLVAVAAGPRRPLLF